MPTMSGMSRRHVKGRYKHMMEGGELVSDAETKKFEDQARQSAGQALQAQQTAMNRQAMAAGQGSVLAGAMQRGAQEHAQKAADAAVTASGQAQTYRDDLREKRRAQIQAEGERQIARNRAAIATGVETAFYVNEAGNILGSALAE
jgi:hypothetical protein